MANQGREEELERQAREAIAALKRDLPSMIQEGNAEAIVLHTAKLSQYLGDVSTSQIRNVFGPVKRIQLEWTPGVVDDKAKALYKQIVLLRPKLRYMVARTTSKRAEKAMRYFQEVMDAAIQQIGEGKDYTQRREYFENFVAFFESLVAFHKQHEKRSSGE